MFCDRACKRAFQALVRIAAILLAAAGGSVFAHAALKPATDGRALRVKVDAAHGKYSIAMPNSTTAALEAGVAVEVDGRWLRAADYPRHSIVQSQVNGELGNAVDWQVTYSGISGAPELMYHVRAFQGEPFGEIQVRVQNTTGKVIQVSRIRSVDAVDGPILDLGGQAEEDRVLSDSFSEDRPPIAVRALGDPPEKYLDSKRHPPAGTERLHRAVGSQLIYNRQSHESLFLGALTSDRFLTILRLHVARAAGGPLRVAAYEVDSAGTTELAEENALEFFPQDRVQLRVPVEPGASLSSERLLFGLSTDYHDQLETYGALIRRLHHARVTAPPLMGWWSWTAFYEGLNEGLALTNAQWEAAHLKPLGFNTFLIDDGYQYARGEYTTTNATKYPDGMASLFYQIRGLGLMPAIWTAPFQVSVRSSVFQHHPDWLVKNAKGQPIHEGSIDGKDPLFILDATNPEAQAYLRTTYSTLVKQWGVRFIKMDFMDDTAVEGYYYKPGTTALEAQRIGLAIIRSAVGEDVYLDKDGSPMLNAVGYVDYGRIGTDTGHTFGHCKRVATSIAARYYMNRNFFVSDPDAVNLSAEIPTGQSMVKPPSLDEARVSIALAAVSGGMLEIGDDLPLLSKSPDRLALIENPDLINMIRLGKSSVPLDLMSFEDKDEQPSIFFLKENARQSILTVFNWTGDTRDHLIRLEAAGLSGSGRYKIIDVLDTRNHLAPDAGALRLSLPPHSVQVLKIEDESVPAVAPVVTVDLPSGGAAGDTLAFAAHAQNGDPVVSYHWDFADGVTLEGTSVTHAFTQAGDYDVRLVATGVDGLRSENHFQVHISEREPTPFDPKKIQRYHPAN